MASHPNFKSDLGLDQEFEKITKESWKSCVGICQVFFWPSQSI
jgi:hypothetical protein